MDPVAMIFYSLIYMLPHAQVPAQQPVEYVCTQGKAPDGSPCDEAKEAEARHWREVTRQQELRRR